MRVSGHVEAMPAPTSLPSAACVDDGPPEEPWDEEDGPAARRSRPPVCRSLREWLLEGVDKSEPPISRSATLPTGYHYEFSRVFGCVALMHTSGTATKDRPLMLGTSPSGSYALGFHYCSADAVHHVLEHSEAWPTLHSSCTIERDPASFEEEPDARTSLLASGFPEAELQAGRSAACCIPVRVPCEWLQEVPSDEAVHGVSRQRRGRRPKKASVSSTSEGSPAPTRERRRKSSGGKRSSHRRIKDEDADEVVGNNNRATKQEQGERSIDSGGAATADVSDDLDGSNADDAGELASTQQHVYASRSDSERIGSPTRNHRSPKQEDPFSRECVGIAEDFVGTEMLQRTLLTLNDYHPQEPAWHVERNVTFALSARIAGRPCSGAAVTISLCFYDPSVVSDGHIGRVGAREGDNVVSAILLFETTGRGMERGWSLAGPASGGDVVRAKTPLLPCGDDEATVCWLSLAWLSRVGCEACLGVGLQAGSDELLRIQVPNVVSKSALKVKISGSEGPWTVELSHTGKLLKQVNVFDFKNMGDSLNLQDTNGRSALMRASLAGDETALRALLWSRADVHARDRMQCTALHHATFAGHATCVTRLLECGASAYARNKSGVNARDLARMKWTPRPLVADDDDPDDPEEVQKAMAHAENGRLVLAAFAAGTSTVGARSVA